MSDTRKKTIYRLMKNETNSVHIQLFRYLFVGSAAFIVDFLSLYALTDVFSVYYLFSAALAFILGLIANYALSINWVFNKRTMDNIWSEFLIFAVIGIIGLGLNEVFIWFFTEYVGLFYLISKIFAASLILFWNFFARKITLFR